MSEEQGKYETNKPEQDNFMEIHPPSSVIAVGDGLKEYQTGAWIKLSTTFREVLHRLKGSRLSVFLCICLHIDTSNTCYPSLETIAKETGYSRREVISAVQELEKENFLTVQREGRRVNLYHVDVAAAMGAENAPVHFATRKTRQNAPKEEPINKNQEERDLTDDTRIFQALEQLTGGLNTSTPRFVDTWLEKHTLERIMQAIDLAKSKGRKPVEYVDSILIGWEANGYPKTREEKVQERKNGKQPQGFDVIKEWLDKTNGEVVNG